PADHLLAVRFEDFLQPFQETILQNLAVGQVLLLHPLLAALTLLPRTGRTLIAAAMKIGPGKKLNHLLNDTSEELIGLLLAWTEHIRGHILNALESIWVSRAEQFRIGHGNVAAVRRHIDFRDDQYMTFRGVLNNLTNLLLGIESAVAPVP